MRQKKKEIIREADPEAAAPVLPNGVEEREEKGHRVGKSR